MSQLLRTAGPSERWSNPKMVGSRFAPSVDEGRAHRRPRASRRPMALLAMALWVISSLSQPEESRHAAGAVATAGRDRRRPVGVARPAAGGARRAGARGRRAGAAVLVPGRRPGAGG